MSANHDVFQDGHLGKEADILKSPGKAFFGNQIGFKPLEADTLHCPAE